MERRYESRPQAVSRSSGWKAALTAVAAVAFITVVVVKPWDAVTVTEVVSADQASPAAAVPSLVPDPTLAPADRSLAIDLPSWPVAVTRPSSLGSVLAAVEGPLSRSVRRSAGWVVAAGGVESRFISDETWVDWQPVSVAPATETPANLAVWPGTGLCTGLPVLRDHPSFISISAPPGLPAPERLSGWWFDGAHVASLAGSVRQIPATGSSRLGILERLDGSHWPAGRYELRLSLGDRTLGLTLCIADSGDLGR